MFKAKWLLVITMLCGVSCFGGDLQKTLLFYENCNDLKSEYPGVKISSSIRIDEKGKFGNCLRIEKRTVNTLDNGDFVKKSSNSWSYRDNAQWKESGGCKNSSSLQINGGKVNISITDIKPDYANAFSFYVKKADGSIDSELSVIWKSYGKEIVLLKDYKPGIDMKRVTLSLVTKGDSGTVTIAVKGSVIIDNAQLDKGVGFFNSFVKPMKRRNVDRIQIPANGKYFNQEKGAISCWINAPWLDSNVKSKSICGIFSVKNAPARIKKWGDDNVLVISCISAKKIDDNPGKLSAFTIDVQNRNTMLSEPLSEIKIDSLKPWHHIVFNWELKNGEMATSLHVDGKKRSQIKPFGATKNPILIYIGYCSGAYLNGLLDDFAIFNRPLTDSEIETISNSNQPISKL